MLLLTAMPVVLFTGTVEVTVGGTPGGLSFLQPAKNTTNSIATIGNTFFSFILVYFKIEKNSQNKGKSLISESVTQLQKRVTTFTYILSLDIALQIIKKRAMLIKQRSFSFC
jgi:hypothetical protein